jgi:hypothetical protein
MPTCKASIKKGKGDRFTRRCDVLTTQAVVFTSVLDEGFVIQTQMPMCSEHLYEKVEQLHAAGIPNHTVNLDV